LEDIIARELEAVRQIHLTERQGLGFRKLHLRGGIPSPLPEIILSLDELRQALGPSPTWLDGLCYQSIAGIAQDTFAVRLISSIEIYGAADGGSIQTICFTNVRLNNKPQPDLQNLAAYAARHDLILVDWCRAQAIPPVEALYAKYFAES
jgi:hypothetical protein